MDMRGWGVDPGSNGQAHSSYQEATQPWEAWRGGFKEKYSGTVAKAWINKMAWEAEGENRPCSMLV